MDGRSGVRVEGLREVLRSLEKAGVEVSDLKDAFTRIGQKVSDDAKSNIASSSATSTGTLAASIRPSKAKSKAVVRAGSARVPYAGVIEYGGYNNIAPKSYLRGAVADNRGDSVRELENEIEAMIRRLDLN